MDSRSNEDLKAIRKIMEQSSRFISLSGWSGILAGTYALIAATLALFFLQEMLDYELGQNRNVLTFKLYSKLLITAFVTLFLALSTGILLTVRKSKKEGVQIWNKLTKRLLINLFVPLLVGALFCVVLYIHHVSYLIGATTLIFYGLALLNASKYTLSDIMYLGYLEILLGVFALFFPGYTLLLWAIGFGILHIIYGLLIQRKYS